MPNKEKDKNEIGKMRDTMQCFNLYKAVISFNLESSYVNQWAPAPRSFFSNLLKVTNYGSLCL